MVEIYSSCQTVIRPAFHHFAMKVNQTSWRVHKDHQKATCKFAKA